MRLTLSRAKYFTFWHFRRTPNYTKSNRQRMAGDRAKYLDHLERWLNYEESSSSPPLDDDVKADMSVPTTKPLDIMTRNRIDSFVDECCKNIALDVTKENGTNGATKSKCVAVLGKVTRMPIGTLLPSCARDEGDEKYAGGFSRAS
jgi:hypothetical protein